MNSIHKQTFLISDLEVDCFGKLKLSSLLYFAQEAAGQHCICLGTDYTTLAQKRLFWAVTRHRVQITRLPSSGEHITIETWPMPTTRVAYPRSMVAYDEQGNELFRSISLWVLMEMENRTMVLPGKSGVTVEGTLLGSELALPHSIIPKNMTQKAERTVTYSCLDRNAHMNNTRYLDWVDDLLHADYHKTHEAVELMINYQNEAREKDHIQMDWQLTPDGNLQVDAHRENTEKKERIFTAQVFYRPVVL